jgi:hypothetical protein
VNNTNLLTRVLIAGVPLLVIALIAGAAGYVSKKADRAPVPALAAGVAGPEGVRGSVQGFTDDELTLITAEGRSIKLRLTADARVEVLTPISASDLRPGDWINGGAIPHADTVLALLGLVVISDPVLQTP